MFVTSGAANVFFAQNKTIALSSGVLGFSINRDQKSTKNPPVTNRRSLVGSTPVSHSPMVDSPSFFQLFGCQ